MIIIQEGMIGLFKAVRDYQPDKAASFQTFARLCIDRQLYKAISGSNRQKHQPLNTYVSLSQETEGERQLRSLWEQNPEAIVIARENVEDLEKRIEECLSSFENQVLECYLRGKDYEQIAAELGRPKKSIDNALHRIRGKVKICMGTTNNKKEY